MSKFVQTRLKKLSFASALVFVVVIPSQSNAVEYNLEVGYEATYSTNSGQTPVDEVQQWIHEPFIGVGLSHESASLELDSEYEVSQRSYQQDDGGRFADEDLLTGETTLDWNVLPDRLSFGVDHYRSERTINSSESTGPLNRQESQIATGTITYRQPTVGTQYLEITGGRSETTFETTDNDSGSQEVRLAYAFPLSSARRWQVVALHRETKFDNFDFFDYDLNSGEVFFSSEAPTGSLEASLGYTKTDPESASVDSVSGVSGSLAIQRGISSPLQWGVTLAREIGDRSTTLGGRPDIPDTELDLLDSASAEAFISTSASFDLISRGTSNIYSLVITTDREDYETAGDREVEMIMAAITRRIRPDLNLFSSVSFRKTNFDESDQKDELVEGRIQLDWGISRRLRLSTSVTYQERSSSEPSVEFSEWTGAITATYAILTNRSQ